VWPREWQPETSADALRTARARPYLCLRGWVCSWRAAAADSPWEYMIVRVLIAGGVSENNISGWMAIRPFTIVPFL